MSWVLGTAAVRTLQGLAVGLALLGWDATGLARAQTVNVVAPTLPPRQASAPAAAQPGLSTSAGGAPSYGAQPASAPSSAAPVQQTMGTQPGPQPGQQAGAPAQGYGQPSSSAQVYGAGAIARSPGAPPSALAARGYSGGAMPGQMGNDVIAGVAPTRSTAAGNCRASPSPDRQSVSLLGADALPRQHVALGEFRAQQIVHSPDGRWAVAFLKLRGQPTFALMSFDLTRCEPQNTVELPSAGDDARFEGDEAVVTLAGGERRVRLSNAHVR
jgi:hypothetical protein